MGRYVHFSGSGGVWSDMSAWSPLDYFDMEKETEGDGVSIATMTNYGSSGNDYSQATPSNQTTMRDPATGLNGKKGSEGDGGDNIFGTAIAIRDAGGEGEFNLVTTWGALNNLFAREGATDQIRLVSAVQFRVRQAASNENFVFSGLAIDTLYHVRVWWNTSDEVRCSINGTTSATTNTATANFHVDTLQDTHQGIFAVWASRKSISSAGELANIQTLFTTRYGITYP